MISFSRENCTSILKQRVFLKKKMNFNVQNKTQKKIRQIDGNLKKKIVIFKQILKNLFVSWLLLKKKKKQIIQIFERYYYFTSGPDPML